MVIKPSTAIRNDYRKVADYCIETGQPVFLTNEGEGELVVMSFQAWREERQRVVIEKALLEIEAEKRAGISRFTPFEEVYAELERIVDEVAASKL